MKTRTILYTILLVLLAAALSACARPAEAIVELNPMPRAAVVVSAEPTPSPAPAGALTAANNFLNWYLHYGVNEYGAPLAPFEEGAHRSCNCITPEYRARIDGIVSVAAQQRGTYDPVANGFGMIDTTSTRLFTSEGTRASVIATLEGMDWAREVTIDLAYTESGWLVDDVRGASIADPAGVTQLFYDWYLDYYRAHGDPLADGAYKSSPYLSDAYINWVTGVQNSFDNDGFDPFVMSRAIPSGAAVMEAQVSGERATVMVNRFLITPQYNPLLVHLEKQGIWWKIVDVTMEEAPATPAEVVESFYEWYREYTAQRNALSDGAYQGSPFLTADFVERVDEALAGMQGGGFDPFVCAQVIPEQITTDGTFVAEMYGPDFANQASVVARTEFAGHVFTVDLTRPAQGEDWQIDNIMCGGSPAGTVKAFYTWFQGCLEESTTCRLPEQDYRTSGFASPALIERVESLRAEFRAAEVGGYNPITMSQADIPAFTLETLSETEEAATVVLTNLAWREHTLRIDLVRADGSWLVDRIGFYTPNTPEAVTRAFLSQYAAVRRFPQDPGVLYNFAPEEHLILELQQSVEAYLQVGAPAGKDPILLENAIPERVEVEKAVLNDNRAVVVASLFAGEGEPASLSVDLRLVDGVWKIASVR